MRHPLLTAAALAHEKAPPSEPGGACQFLSPHGVVIFGHGLSLLQRSGFPDPSPQVIRVALRRKGKDAAASADPFGDPEVANGDSAPHQEITVTLPTHR